DVPPCPTSSCRIHRRRRSAIRGSSCVPRTRAPRRPARAFTLLQLAAPPSRRGPTLEEEVACSRGALSRVVPESRGRPHGSSASVLLDPSLTTSSGSRGRREVRREPQRRIERHGRVQRAL